MSGEGLNRLAIYANFKNPHNQLIYEQNSFWIFVGIAILAPGFSSYSQKLPVAMIEVFGNRQVSTDSVLQKAGIHEGDTIAMFDFAKSKSYPGSNTYPQ
jgi:hypothetical protein